MNRAELFTFLEKNNSQGDFARSILVKCFLPNKRTPNMRVGKISQNPTLVRVIRRSKKLLQKKKIFTQEEK